MRQRIIHINVVHIEGMLRQFQLTKLKHLCTVNDRMHQDILIQTETSDILPFKNLILRKNIVITDNLLMCHANFLINIVRNDHVYF